MEDVDLLYVILAVGGTLAETYDDLNQSLTIRVPRWAWPIVLVLGLGLLGGCLCVSLWPALSEIWRPFLGG